MDAELSRSRFDLDIKSLLLSPEVYKSAGIRLLNVSYPSLLAELDWHAQGRKLLLKIDATDWDYRPPKGWWVDTEGAPLRVGIPQGLGFQTASDVFGEGRAWFCFPGWREYHDHPSHQQPTWASIRKNHSLPGLIMQLQADLNKAGVSTI